jgi:uncharacterized membrane protein YagU involved in acid resistance
MEKQFEEYRPKFERQFQKGIVLLPIKNSSIDLLELILVEQWSNLRGDLTASLMAVLFPVIGVILYSIGRLDYTYEDELSKYIGIGVVVLIFIGGLAGFLKQLVKWTQKTYAIAY